MQQVTMWYDSIYDAVLADVGALGGPKVVGPLLWPTIDCPHQSGAKLRDCLNPKNKQKLCITELLFIKREACKAGSFATVFFEMEQIGMSRPEPIEPENEVAKLQQQLIDTHKSMERMASRIERIAGLKYD